MNERIALYGWIGRHGLDAARARALLRLAGFGSEPPAVRRSLWHVVAIAAAALGGLGVILWIAANWGNLGRSGRFALLQGAVLAMCAGAALLPRVRPALGLMALLCIGGLFAFYGQTYQTGADAWQLFALWSLLALPLCLAARSDVLWAPWAVIVSVAISQWIYAHTGQRWRAEPQDLQVYLAGWAAAALLVVALSPATARVTGAGAWALRTAATGAVAMVGVAALFALFNEHVGPHYTLGLVVFGAAAAALLVRRWFDVFLFSVVALGFDGLVVAGIGRALLERSGSDMPLRLLVVGLAAAGLLAASVSLVLRLAKRRD